MFFLSRPSESTIRTLLAERSVMEFSYPSVGATRTKPPFGWRTNHVRKRLGKGRTVNDSAVRALFSWQLLAVNGLEVLTSSGSLAPKTDVAILSRHFGIWSLDFCRVIYVLNDESEKDGAIQRTGFAYGTLPGHAVRGEEIFSIEWHTATEEVWYDILSFSLLASPLARLAAPLARATQKHFASASIQAALNATHKAS